MTFKLVMSTLPSMVLIPCLKPWKDFFFTLSTNLRTLLKSAAKGLYDMSSFPSWAMLFMIFKTIYSIFLPNSSLSPWIHWISLTNYKQVTMSSSTLLFAGGHSLHASLLHTILSNSTFGCISFNWSLIIHQPSKGSDDFLLSFYPLQHWTSHWHLCLHLFHCHMWIALLAPNAACWSHNINHSMHKVRAQSTHNQCHQTPIPQVAKNNPHCLWGWTQHHHSLGHTPLEFHGIANPLSLPLRCTFHRTLKIIWMRSFRCWTTMASLNTHAAWLQLTLIMMQGIQGTWRLMQRWWGWMDRLPGR